MTEERAQLSTPRDVRKLAGFSMYDFTEASLTPLRDVTALSSVCRSLGTNGAYCSNSFCTRKWRERERARARERERENNKENEGAVGEREGHVSRNAVREGMSAHHDEPSHSSRLRSSSLQVFNFFTQISASMSDATTRTSKGVCSLAGKGVSRAVGVCMKK